MGFWEGFGIGFVSGVCGGFIYIHIKLGAAVCAQLYVIHSLYLAVDPLAVPLEELHPCLALLLGDKGSGDVPPKDDEARLGLL